MKECKKCFKPEHECTCVWLCDHCRVQTGNGWLGSRWLCDKCKEMLK